MDCSPHDQHGHCKSSCTRFTGWPTPHLRVQFCGWEASRSPHRQLWIWQSLHTPMKCIQYMSPSATTLSLNVIELDDIVAYATTPNFFYITQFIYFLRLMTQDKEFSSNYFVYYHEHFKVTFQLAVLTIDLSFSAHDCICASENLLTVLTWKMNAQKN